MRSKSLLTSNILATIYSIGLIVVFISAIAKAGGADWLRAFQAYFSLVLNFFANSSDVIKILYVIIFLLCIHIILFIIGSIIGWISFAVKKSGLAKFAAVIYLIGTICFPIYIIFGLPITIVGFAGGSSQKKLNHSV